MSQLCCRFLPVRRLEICRPVRFSGLWPVAEPLRKQSDQVANGSSGRGAALNSISASVRTRTYTSRRLIAGANGGGRSLRTTAPHKKTLGFGASEGEQVALTYCRRTVCPTFTRPTADSARAASARCRPSRRSGTRPPYPFRSSTLSTSPTVAIAGSARPGVHAVLGSSHSPSFSSNSRPCPTFRRLEARGWCGQLIDPMLRF